MGKHCEVCKDAESKYKCPICLTPYCSLVCYKKHKEIPCSKSDANGSEAVKKVEEPPPLEPEETEESSHRLRRTQLEAVAASEDIRSALRNSDLQDLISKIDASRNPKVLVSSVMVMSAVPHKKQLINVTTQDLEKAMEGPAFLEFTDKLLSIISPEDV